MKWFLIFFPMFSMAMSLDTWVDKSESAFFPKAFGEKIATYKSFPAFWWNFLILTPTKGNSVLPLAQALCEELKKQDTLAQVECAPDPSKYLPIIKDWARDVVIRESPPQNLMGLFSSALAKASLPIPKSVLTVLRNDPFESYEKLREIVKKRLQLGMQMKEGFFQDENTGTIFIPILAAFPPSESDKIEPFFTRLLNHCHEKDGCHEIVLLGPHGSTLENKLQIQKDLIHVSRAGILIFLLTCLGLYLLKRIRFAVHFLPVLFGTAMAALCTVLIFGKIHGLTLSFGTGIIGMIVDYGLQGAFHENGRSVWKSNAISFCTTVICLFIISFTAVPLLRQLMVFSILGFSFGFLFLYLSRSWMTRFVPSKPLNIKIHTSKILSWLSISFLIMAFTLPFFTTYRFDLQQFNFQTAATTKMTDWFFKKLYPTAPLLEIQDTTPNLLSTTHIQKEFAEKFNITIENVANYLPTLTEQKTHIKEWKQYFCEGKTLKTSLLETSLNETQRKLFQPFLSQMTCANIKTNDLTKAYPSYLKHLTYQDKWLTLWFPKNLEQSKIIRQQFPEAISLKEVIDIFPLILTQEMKWMFPISLFCITLLLFSYFRNLWHSLIALIPFFTALGLTLVLSILFHIPVSFVSLIALIMVLGFSVDYAVFTIDALLGKLKSKPSTLSGLVFAATSTLFGFIPLLFCEHQVLKHLGLGLTFGILGTLLGTFYGIPYFLTSKNK